MSHRWLSSRQGGVPESVLRNCHSRATVSNSLEFPMRLCIGSPIEHWSAQVSALAPLFPLPARVRWRCTWFLARVPQITGSEPLFHGPWVASGHICAAFALVLRLMQTACNCRHRTETCRCGVMTPNCGAVPQRLYLPAVLDRACHLYRRTPALAGRALCSALHAAVLSGHQHP